VKKRFLSVVLVAVFAGAFVLCPAASPAQSSSARGAAARKKKSSKQAKRRPSKRARKIHRAFVASASLKPMAKQLVADRTPAAYRGVEAYARRHSADDAGTLAWLALGYARLLDRDYSKAIPALKRAQTHPGELSDYVSYYLGSAYLGAGDTQASVAALRTFDADYPDSVFQRDAAVLYARALTAQNQPNQAIAILEAHRQPVRSDLELALGRAYIAAGDNAKAVEVLRRIYALMPLSAEADDAGTNLKTLSFTPTYEERKQRSAALLRGRRWVDAAREYRDLLGDAPADDRAAVQVALGEALHHNGRDRDARELLESITGATGEMNAERLNELVEIARSADDLDRVQALVSQMRQASPGSPWLAAALMSLGNMQLLRKDLDRAMDAYREIDQHFPQTPRAAYAHWKATWLTLRQSRREQGKQDLEDQIARYPTSPEVPAALYWRARLAEQDRDLARSRAYYRKLIDRFPNYYYADLARARVQQLGEDAQTESARGREAGDATHVSNDGGGAAGDLALDPVLQKIPAANLPSALLSDDPPDDDVRMERAQLLENGGLTNLAVRELQAATVPGKNSGWALVEMAKLYQDAGRYDMALEVVKRALPEYFAFDITALPRSYWEALFPRPFWNDLQRNARANRLDPFLVAALVRQESEFNPGAVSRANAVGLMQLLPGTGRKVARELRVRRFNTQKMLNPATNLQLGTKYFRSMVDQYNGTVEYALAAYNAGADRVQGWLAEGNFPSTEEFVESIPFTETREYVQAIMRNASLYRRLYTATSAGKTSTPGIPQPAQD